MATTWKGKSKHDPSTKLGNLQSMRVSLQSGRPALAVRMARDAVKEYASAGLHGDVSGQAAGAIQDHHHSARSDAGVEREAGTLFD